MFFTYERSPCNRNVGKSGRVSVTSPNTDRMLRGNDNRTDGRTWMDVAQVAFDGLGTHIGFRPVVEFIEPDRLQEKCLLLIGDENMAMPLKF